MKNLALALIAFASLSAHALEFDYAAEQEDPKLPRHIMSEAFAGNPDGTFTVKGPRLVRGNRNYPFAYSTDKTGVCRSMGFESFLPQSAFNLRDNSVSRAYVNTDGSYQVIKDAEYDSISEITCFNGYYRTHTKIERFIENSDNTVTIYNPRLVRGNRSYVFAYSNEKTSVCRSMGFSNALEQSAFNLRDNGASRAYVNVNGEYVVIKDAEYDSINEITCHNGANTTVVIDVNGNTYFRRN